MFHRILIANRGEIAVRIIRTCRELEIETVAVYSTADADALHVKLATEAVCIGPAKAADSYLNMSAILTAALETGCDAIHPGYGFLSENPEFADLCRQCGLKFIGPSGDVIRQMGNKAAARALMQATACRWSPAPTGRCPARRRPPRSPRPSDTPSCSRPAPAAAAAVCAGWTPRRTCPPSTPPPRRRRWPASETGSSMWRSSSSTPGTSSSRSWPTARGTWSTWGSGTAPSSGRTRSSSRSPPPRP